MRAFVAHVRIRGKARDEMEARRMLEELFESAGLEAKIDYLFVLG